MCRPSFSTYLVYSTRPNTFGSEEEVTLKSSRTTATMASPIKTCFREGIFRCGDDDRVPVHLALKRGRSVFFRRRNPILILQCLFAASMSRYRSTAAFRAEKSGGNWLFIQCNHSQSKEYCEAQERSANLAEFSTLSYHCISQTIVHV